MSAYCVVTSEKSFCVPECALRGSFSVFLFVMKGSAQVFSALLPLGNYKLKSNQISGASGVEVKQLLDTAKSCGSNPAGPFFLQTGVVVLFRTILRLFIFVVLVPVVRCFISIPKFCNRHS